MGVTIRQKIKGRDKPWTVFICRDYRRKSITVGSRQAAVKVARNIEAQLALGQFSFDPEKEMPTFQAYAEHWLEHHGEQNLKPSTLVNYKATINRYLVPTFGKLTLDQITPARVNDFLISQGSRGLTAATIRNHKNILSAVLKTAQNVDEHITRNPCDAIDKIKDPGQQDNDRKVTFTLEQRTRFENVIRELYPQYHSLVVVGFRTGLRIGELIGLQWSDIDWKNRLISVNRTVTRGVVGPPKSKASGRQVRMSAQVVDVLRSALVKAKQQKLEQGWRELPEWIFTGANGQPVVYNNFLSRLWKPALEKADLEGLTPHSMRSAYTTHRIDAGHPVHEVSRELGHSSVNVTMAAYYKFRPELSECDIDVLDMVVG